MYTISMVVTPDETGLVTASEWPRNGRYPVVVFSAEWRLPRPFRTRREALQFMSRAAGEFLDNAELFDA